MTFNTFLDSNPADGIFIRSSPIYTYYQYSGTGVVWEGNVGIYTGYGRPVELFSYVRYYNFGSEFRKTGLCVMIRTV